MKPTYEELEARVSELSKALDVSLRVQADQAKRMGQILLEIKRSEAVVGSLGWMSLDVAISLELSKLNKQISDLQGQVRLLTEQRDTLVVEGAVLIDLARKFADRADEYKGCLMGFSVFESFNELKSAGGKEATSSAIASLRAEGVEMLTEYAGQEYQQPSKSKAEKSQLKFVVLLGTAFARQLRESKGESKL